MLLNIFLYAYLLLYIFFCEVLSFKTSLYILDASLVSDICFENIFSQSVACFSFS